MNQPLDKAARWGVVVEYMRLLLRYGVIFYKQAFVKICEVTIEIFGAVVEIWGLLLFYGGCY